jgi:prophage tail gpP-like protein
MPDDDALALVVDGRRFTGWHSVSVRRSLEEMADSFSLSYAELGTAGPMPPQIVAGVACTLLLGREVLVQGYVDRAEASYDHASHALQCSGRSKLGDLVDCSALRKGGAWLDTSIADIASDLCAPFGVQVLDQTNAGKVTRFAIDPGETVHEVLVRLSRVAGVLVVASADMLVFTRSTGTDRTRTVLRYGQNLLSGRRETDLRDRFSEYSFYAQTPKLGASDVATDQPGDGAWLRRVLDEQVPRYRPFRMATDAGQVTPAVADPTRKHAPRTPPVDRSKSALLRRAIWERNVRRGKSERLSYRVPGWTMAEGLAWMHGFLVAVDDPQLGAAGDWLVVSATLSRDDAGTVTDLELTRPEAFDVVEQAPQRKAVRRVLPRMPVLQAGYAGPPLPDYLRAMGPPPPPPVRPMGPPRAPPERPMGPPPPPPERTVAAPRRGSA